MFKPRQLFFYEFLNIHRRIYTAPRLIGLTNFSVGCPVFLFNLTQMGILIVIDVEDVIDYNKGIITLHNNG